MLGFIQEQWGTPCHVFGHIELMPQQHSGQMRNVKCDSITIQLITTECDSDFDSTKPD